MKLALRSLALACSLIATAALAACPLDATLIVQNATIAPHTVRVTDTEGCGFDVTFVLPAGTQGVIAVPHGGLLPLIDSSRSMPISVDAGAVGTVVIQ